MEDYIFSTLLPEGHRVIVTSRPEGVRLPLYEAEGRFVVLHLLALSHAQQRKIISTQLKADPFYTVGADIAGA